MSRGLWLLSCGLASIATSAYAQDSAPPAGPDPSAVAAQNDAEAPAAANDAGLGEVTDAGDIIVTATRRNEALSDVPLSVSAVTAQTLQNSGATDIRQLNQVSPSLLVSSTSSEAGAGTARIRGIGTVGDNPGLESSVATFIDGVYRNRSGVGLTELGGIDRIEVLRGPQGTLFGRNASAGLIHVITAKPKFEDEGAAEASYGNYDFYRFAGSLTGPISEQIAYRIDGVYTKRDGFIKEVLSGRRVNNRDRYLVRGQLLFEPSDALSIRIIGDYSDRDEECCAAPYLPTRDVSRDASGNLVSSPSSIARIVRGLGGIINDDTFARRVALTPGQSYRGDVRDYGVSGEVNWDLGEAAKLTSITAYRDWRWLRGQDADFNNLDILHRQDDGTARQTFKTFTQELRLQGELFDGRLDWLVGGYYAREKLRLNDNLSYGSDYERYANCLLFASVLPTAVNPTPTGNCVNVPVVTGTISGLVGQRTALLNAGVPATDPRIVALSTNISVLGATVANPARPGFGSLAAALGQPGFTFANVGLRDRYDQLSRNYAFFTHNVFEIADGLKVTVGARYTNERKTLDATFTDNNTLCRAISASPLAALQTLPCVIPSVPGGSLTLENGRIKESKFTYTGVLSYKPTPELLVYGSYSKGYKAGGFNLDRNGLNRIGRILYTDGSTLVNGQGAIDNTANLQQLAFRPEGVYAAEVGLKYNGRGFDFNVSAFHQVFDNFQLNTFNGVNFVVENINGCSADLGATPSDASSTNGACTGKVKGGVVSKGVEMEAFIRPVTDFNVALGATLVDSKYRRNLVGTDGRPLNAAFFQLPGRRVSNAAQYTFTGSASWTPPIGDGGLRGLLYADFRYQSELNTGSDLDLEKINPGTMVVNARVGLTGGEGQWSIEFWGANVFDKNYYQVGFDSPLQGSNATSATGATTRGVQQGFITSSNQLFGAFLGEPRTYGVTVRTKF